MKAVMRLLALLGLVTGLAACPLPGPIPCESDADCPDGGRCDTERYYCVPADGAEDAAPATGQVGPQRAPAADLGRDLRLGQAGAGAQASSGGAACS